MAKTSWPRFFAKLFYSQKQSKNNPLTRSRQKERARLAWAVGKVSKNPHKQPTTRFFLLPPIQTPNCAKASDTIAPSGPQFPGKPLQFRPSGTIKIIWYCWPVFFIKKKTGKPYFSIEWFSELPGPISKSLGILKSTRHDFFEKKIRRLLMWNSEISSKSELEKPLINYIILFIFI